MVRRCCRRWSGSAREQTARRAGSSAILFARGERGADAVGAGTRFEVGGVEEAVLRALIYIRLPEGSVDERGFPC